MTTLMQVLRYESGMVGEEAADLIESLEKEIDILRDERDVITKERDELREQVRQHEAFQQFANASEQQRLNDARLEGWRLAQQQAADKCQELENESSVCNMIDGADCADAIRALHPPAEWASSEQCGGAPNTEWKHPDGFGGGLMGEKE